MLLQPFSVYLSAYDLRIRSRELSFINIEIGIYKGIYIKAKVKIRKDG